MKEETCVIYPVCGKKADVEKLQTAIVGKSKKLSFTHLCTFDYSSFRLQSKQEERAVKFLFYCDFRHKFY